MEFSISLPEWAQAELKNLPDAMPDIEERMAAVVNFHNSTSSRKQVTLLQQHANIADIAVNRILVFHIPP